jgi:hypothetical protein
VFYNILHFIAYYPALTQLGFTFSVKLSKLVSINFKGVRCFGGPLFELGARGKVPAPLSAALHDLYEL